MTLATEVRKFWKQRSILFAIFAGALLLLFFSHLHQLILFSFSQQHYSHIVLIPFVNSAQLPRVLPSFTTRLSGELLYRYLG